LRSPPAAAVARHVASAVTHSSLQALTRKRVTPLQSAALGIAVAGALSMGYANIFVTSPSPENLRTLFEFVFKGLDALGYKEHIDYDLVESTNPAFGARALRLCSDAGICTAG
jgi:N-acetyltransferase 10